MMQSLNPPSGIAIIPARGGSKRVPRKNLSPVCGKPMIAWAIETALRSQLFDEVIVSSDDAEILAVSAAYGARPYQRPAYLADDQTHVGPVVEDCLSALTLQPESTCLLYATALLLQPHDLRAAHTLLQRQDVASVLSIAEFESPIQRAYKMEDDAHIAMAQPEFFHWRSQDLPKRYRDTGMFSWWKQRPEGGKNVGLLIPKSRAVDIDTPEDLELAMALFEFHQKKDVA